MNKNLFLMLVPVVVWISIGFLGLFVAQYQAFAEVNRQLIGRPTHRDIREGLALDGQFDAVVGRYVLTHLVDPASVLRRLMAHLRPGGLRTGTGVGCGCVTGRVRTGCVTRRDVRRRCCDCAIEKDRSNNTSSVTSATTLLFHHARIVKPPSKLSTISGQLLFFAES